MKTNAVLYEPTTLLRLEAAAVLALCLGAFSTTGASWIHFALLFLVPDVSMLGYLRNTRFGAFVYNLGHSYTAPLLAASLYWAGTGEWPSPLWLVWPAHIAFDRLLGYGLKQGAGFRFTHLGELKAAGSR